MTAEKYGSYDVLYPEQNRSDIEIANMLKSLSGLIKRDCSQWLTEAGNLVGYRGIREIEDHDPYQIAALKGVPPTNRDPKDTTTAMHNAVNQMLVKNIGFSRANSIFVSGAYRTARSYGNVFLIFPKDGYKFAWSSKINDLTVDIDSANFKYNIVDYDKNSIAEFKNFFKDPANRKDLISKMLTKRVKETLENSIAREFFWNRHLTLISDEPIREFIKGLPADITKISRNTMPIHLLNNIPTREGGSGANIEIDRLMAVIKKDYDVAKRESAGTNFKDAFQHYLRYMIPNKTLPLRTKNYNPRKLNSSIGKHFQTDDLQAALNSSNEIILTCDFYYGVANTYSRQLLEHLK